MIDRRDFIKKSLVSPLAMLPAQYPSALVAQSPVDYKDILSNGMVPGDTRNFWFLRNISLNFVLYRAWLNVPFGYEGESDWLPRAVLAWLSAFPLVRIEEVFPPEGLSGDSVPDFALTGSYVYVEPSDPNSWLNDPNSWLSDPNSWLSDSWLSDPNSWLSDVDNAGARISMREEFEQRRKNSMRRSFSRSDDGWNLADALEETFSNRKDDFFEWCNSAGITETQTNNILSAQALFAIHFAMHNVTWRENGIIAADRIGSIFGSVLSGHISQVKRPRIVEIFKNFTWIWPFC